MRENYLSMNKLSGEGYIHVFKHHIRQAYHNYTYRTGPWFSAKPYGHTNIPKLFKLLSTRIYINVHK
jgi:hypothetical protein